MLSATVLSFDGFFAEQHPRLVRLLTAMTGRPAVAEELAQEALFSAYRRWDAVRELDRPDLWVRRAALNRAISAHRRVVAEVAALTRVGQWRAPSVAFAPRDEELWTAVRQLSTKQAAAIVLSIDGFTAGDIGDVLGCSEETARTHLRRARARLAEVLDEEDEG